MFDWTCGYVVVSNPESLNWQISIVFRKYLFNSGFDRCEGGCTTGGGGDAPSVNQQSNRVIELSASRLRVIIPSHGSANQILHSSICGQWLALECPKESQSTVHPLLNHLLIFQPPTPFFSWGLWGGGQRNGRIDTCCNIDEGCSCLLLHVSRRWMDG